MHILRNISQAILAVRLILKEHKIGKLHEAFVQRFCQRSSQSSYMFFGKFEPSTSESNTHKDFASKGFFNSTKMVRNL